ncbi:MAG: serine/threonine protein phosphatase [Bacteroidales bacterium]|nr:serine/threonine protein phosphatase [Bacteroidales bacterium]
MRRKSLWLLLVLFLFSYTLPAQQDVYEKPSLSDENSWSLILFPDVQTYVKFDYNQPILDLMVAWVSNNMETLNTKMVLCTGDLVEQNDLFNPNGKSANQASVSQWEAVSSAFGRLDGLLPYILTTGNHDYGILSAENRFTHFDTYFPPNKNRLNQKMLREVGTNVEGRPTLANATYEFVSPHGRKFLVLVLEFAPRDETLEWAKKVIEKEQYNDHTVILLTHSYLDHNNNHIVKEGYKLSNPNYGEAIWQKLVQPSKNIEMVLAGHIAKPDDLHAHIAFRVDKNAAGKKVSQMVFNAQALGGGWHGNGGDGWLRILEFLPDGKTVKVKTFSPLFAISPTTQKYAWRTESYDEFTFELD